MVIQIIDDSYDSTFETWYEINSDDKKLIENILAEAYDDYNSFNCEPCDTLCMIFEDKLWDNDITFGHVHPDMVFEIENTLRRIY